MDYLANNYIALTLIPIGTLIIISLISYKLGLRLLSSIVIGLITSLISIVIIHRFHFDHGRLINETGNLYVSIYILTDLIMLIFSFCYIILKKPKETTFLKCCSTCIDEKGPDYLYENTNNTPVDQDSIDVHGYTSDRIEHYNPDILGDTSNEVNTKYEYRSSGFTSHIKDKKRFESPLPKISETTDDSWNEGHPIPISEYHPTEIIHENTFKEDDGLIYESKPKKWYTSSISDTE